WRGTLPLRTVIAVGVLFHAVAVAIPLLLSHDVYYYVAYGRIATLHHANPYLIPPSAYPSDPTHPFLSVDWLHITSLYGPAFVQLASLLTKLIRGLSGLILAFKLLSGLASLATMLIVASLAHRLMPWRAGFAAALIG